MKNVEVFKLITFAVKCSKE